MSPGSAVDAIRKGIALVPEDRKAQGLFLEMAVRGNLALPSLRVEQKAGVVNRSAERRVSAGAIKQLGIKTPSDRQIAQYLSGGNQQKVVLGKALMTEPRVIILDEPTRGVDVGAKAEVHRLVSDLAAGGMGVLMISSDLPEVLAMSDRVLVMREGRLTAELAGAEATAERVIAAATGQFGSTVPHGAQTEGMKG